MAVLTQAGAHAAVVAAVKAVPGIGIVHDYRRVLPTEAAMTALYRSDAGIINAWCVYPAQTSPVTNIQRRPGYGGIGTGIRGGMTATLRFQVLGHYEHIDAKASEKTFAALCWTLFDALNAVAQMHADAIQNEPTTWDEFGYRMLANTHLTHYAQFTVGLWAKLS